MSGAAGALGPIAAVTGLAGTGLQAYGTYREYKDYSRALAYNAQVARMQAEAESRAGEFAASRILKKGQIFQGQQRALFAKAGVKLEGSPIAVLADTETEFELDAMAERYNASVRASQAESTARIREFESRAALAAGKLRATATLLTGASESAKTLGLFNKFFNNGGGGVGGSSLKGTPISTTYGGRTVYGVRR